MSGDRYEVAGGLQYKYPEPGPARLGEEPPTHVEKWTMYMLDRKGDYAFRSATRYKVVADKLFSMGLRDEHVLMDIGAGSCQFMHYLSRERGWMGRYRPVDAVIDGHNLELWEPPAMKADYTVCIEVLEHLSMPHTMLCKIEQGTRYAAVITTPNPQAVDVIACDPTHISAVHGTMLSGLGWSYENVSLFGRPLDTTVAFKTFAR